MASIDEVVGAYLAAWNERDAAARRRLLERAWTEDASYTDPTAHVEGREALVLHIDGFHAQMPGSHLVATSDIDEHHGRVRFAWALKGPDGALVTEGVDFGELAGDGRFRFITGFFGPLPGGPS